MYDKNSFLETLTMNVPSVVVTSGAGNKNAWIKYQKIRRKIWFNLQRQ